jgi:hypothetical protein
MSNHAFAGAFRAELKRIAHYRELSAQFQSWAERESIPEACSNLLEMARQYGRAAAELEAAVEMRQAEIKATGILLNGARRPNSRLNRGG